MSHNAMCPFLWFVVRLVFVENISQQQKNAQYNQNERNFHGKRCMSYDKQYVKRKMCIKK